jgi:reactive intermediate/imine deaminase
MRPFSFEPFMRFPIALAAALLAACTVQPASETTRQRPLMEHINLHENWPYPFSSAVRVGNMLYLSGQMGTQIVDGAPKLVAGGIEAETRQTLDNIRTILEKSGSSMDRVVKCMVMMADMKEWPKLNEIYATYFPGPKPARSAWGAAGLALGGRVEITCIATV